MGRRYVLELAPYLSAQVDNRAAFGYYYANNGDQFDRAPFTLSALRARGNALSVAAANAAWEWVRGAGRQIFATIANLEGWEDGGRDAVNFTHVETEPNAGARIRFHFEELAGGAVAKLRDEVRNGGDTWDCGDFGDIDRSIASEAGAVDAWDELCAAAGSGAVELRLTLCDEDADVVALERIE